ncbi:hypothetical protein BJX64DRAFT_267699 [Aspergillus heterothallicus]
MTFVCSSVSLMIETPVYKPKKHLGIRLHAFATPVIYLALLVVLLQVSEANIVW